MVPCVGGSAINWYKLFTLGKLLITDSILYLYEHIYSVDTYARREPLRHWRTSAAHTERNFLHPTQLNWEPCLSWPCVWHNALILQVQYDMASIMHTGFPVMATTIPLPLLSSLWVSRTGSASDWCALQEALYKCIDTIQYSTFHEHSCIDPKSWLKLKDITYYCSFALNYTCMYGVNITLKTGEQ